MVELTDGVQGFFDGYRGGAFEGWAWRPDRPDESVWVEVFANGFRLGEAEASIYRPDLRTAGIGHGRFGFSLAFPIDPDRPDPVQVSVRIKDGPTLPGGDTIIGGAPPLSEADSAAFQAFVAAVLGSGEPRAAVPEEPDRPTHFIVHSPTGSSLQPAMLGVAEYSYAAVLQAFLPVLQTFGDVHVVDDPARQVDLLCEAHLARGEPSLYLSFAPPHRTTLGLRCPTIPVFAWEYGTLPTSVWDDEKRHDWRWVLRQTGRAIALSQAAAQAAKAAMGEDFPVVAIPAPVWDRRPERHGLPSRPRTERATLRVDGFVFDSRSYHFEPEMAYPPPPAAGEAPDTVDLDGVVFTSVFSPKDGRKNWMDMVTAFLLGLGERSDATLVLKMVGADPEPWWWELLDELSRAPRFQCRIVVLHGFLQEDDYGRLIQASHWAVNASRGEGLCLPLLEFMCAGRPAIAPAHSAMADYLDATCALPVAWADDYAGWPQDTRRVMTSIRHQVSWSALRDALLEGYRMVKEDEARYLALSQAAARRMQAFCSDQTVAGALSRFLGLGSAARERQVPTDRAMVDAAT